MVVLPPKRENEQSFGLPLHYLFDAIPVGAPQVVLATTASEKRERRSQGFWPGGQSGDTAKAMSQENIEALQRAAEANNRRDYEAILDEFDPDVEWHGIFGVMFGGEATVVRGREGLLGYVRDLDESLTYATFSCRNSVTLAIESSYWVMSGAEAERAASSSTRPTEVWPSSRTASASGTGTSSTTPRPSKQGCGSSQCRRRTSTASANTPSNTVRWLPRTRRSSPPGSGTPTATTIRCESFPRHGRVTALMRSHDFRPRT